MLTTAPYLRTRRPSPTTAEFIVSTLPPMTVPLRIALCAVYLLRLVLALGVLLLLYSAWTQSPYSTTAPLDVDIQAHPLLSIAFVHQTLRSFLRTRIGALFSLVASSLPPWVLLPFSLGALYVLSQRIGVEERFLVLRGLGIQTSSSGATLFSSVRTRFIPTDKVQDVLVNEAFRGFGVRHYLIVLVKGEDRLVVVFPKLLPRLDTVVDVWQGARECLWEDGGKEKNTQAGWKGLVR